MNKNYLKYIVVILLGIFFASYLLFKIPLPVAQDLARQIQNGQDVLAGHFDVLTKNFYSYTEPNQPFANHHWFYGVIAYLLHITIGFSGIVILKTILFLLLFWLLFVIVKHRVNFWLFAFFSIPAMVMFLGRADFRPELFSYLFIAIWIYTLLYLEKKPQSNNAYWLIFLELLWVNIHLYFPVGILLTTGFLLERIILKYKTGFYDETTKKLSIILGGSIVAMFINPFGLGGVVHSLSVNTSSNFPIYSSELGSLANVFKYSPRIDSVGALPFQLMIIALALSFVAVIINRIRSKKPILENHILFFFVASVATAFLGYSIIRALPLFAIIFVLAMTNNIQELFELLQIWAKKFFAHMYNSVAFGMVLFFIIIPLIYLTFFARYVLSPYNYFGIGVTPNAERSAQFFKDNNIKGPIFNDTDVGSYLIYHFFPEEKVFTDNRFGDAYSASFFRTIYNPMIKDEDRWKEALAKYDFNVIFFYQYDGGEEVRNFLFRRFYDPEWVLVYTDNYNVIFVRNNSLNQEVIQKYGITLENMTQKLAFLTESDDPEDHLAAADIYGLFGQVHWAMDQYLRFLSEVPTRGKVWLALGRMELNRGDQQNANPYRGAIYLEQAIAHKWITPESLSYLALAYYRTGQVDRAKEMVRWELRLDPESTDAHRWLGVFAEYDAQKERQ